MNFIFNLNWADYVIIAILTFSVVVGLLRGFIREVLTIVVWVLAFYIAIAYASTVSAALSTTIVNASMRYIVSFVLLLICMLFIGAIINYLMGKIIKTTGLSGTDRVLGLGFGLIRGVLLIGVLVMFAMHTTLIDDPWWKESQTIGQFEQVGDSIKSFLPEEWTKWLDQMKASAEEIMKQSQPAQPKSEAPAEPPADKAQPTQPSTAPHSKLSTPAKAS